jgi:hypothetical protein
MYASFQTRETEGRRQIRCEHAHTKILSDKRNKMKVFHFAVDTDGIGG